MRCIGWHVLNAFRHQRMDHPEPLLNQSPATSAQRLSASTNGSPARLPTMSLRIRGCSTPFGINEWITYRHDGSKCAWRLVLNAFRHQRMDHNRCRHKSNTTTRCSTPFGINEWITRVPSDRADRDSCRVLNAFRHQRMDHYPTSRISLPVRSAQRLSASTNGSPVGYDQQAWGDMCSTPFGINEWITVTQADPLADGLLVLNAFRHQRMDHD